MQKLFRSLIAIGGLAGLVACGDDVSITPPPDPDLAISGAPVTAIQVGARVQLSSNLPATWASSNAAVASVDAAGLVTAVAAGTASITATSTADVNKKASVTITVTAPAVRSVTVSPTAVTMNPGGTQGFVANVDADPGVARTVTWTSTNTAVVTVTAAGVATAVAPGAATITATSTANTSVSGAASVTVRTPTQPRVSIQKVTVAGNLNAPVNLAATAGQIDVTIDVDPGDFIAQRVELLVDGVVVGSQSFTAAQSRDLTNAHAFADLTAAVTSTVISFNTAQFNPVTGAVGIVGPDGVFRPGVNFNGPHQLSARLISTGGTSGSTATPSANLAITFANANTWLANMTETGTTAAATGTSGTATGLAFRRGGMSFSVIPVIYNQGQSVVAAGSVVNFGSAVCDASGTGTRVAALSGTSAPFAANLPQTTAGGVALVNTVQNYEFNTQNPACLALFPFGEFPTLTAVDNFGNSIMVGALPAITAAVRRDNRAPGAPSFMANPNIRQNGWINAGVGLTGSNAASANNWIVNGTADAGIGGGTTAGAAYQRFLRIGDAAAGTVAAANAATASSTPALPAPTVQNNSLCAVASARDELGNESALPGNATACLAPPVASNTATGSTHLRFGVDIAPPTAAFTGGSIAANARINGAALGNEFFVALADTGAVGNSGMLAGTPMIASVVRRNAAGSAGAGNCVVGTFTGGVCTQSATGVNGAAVVTTGIANTTTLAAQTVGGGGTGYYTFDGTAFDAAGNSTVVANRVAVYDNTPATATPPAVPATITGTFSAAAFLNDELSIRDYFWTVRWAATPTALFGLGPTTATIAASPTVVDAYNAATLNNINFGINASITTFLGLQNGQGATPVAYPGAANLMDLLNLFVRDQTQAAYTGPASSPVAPTVPAAAGVSVTNFNGAFALASSNTTICAGNTGAPACGATPTATVFTATAAGATAVFNNPFTRVDFYAVNAAGTNMVLIGSVPAASATLVDNGIAVGGRVWTYTLPMTAANLYTLLGGVPNAVLTARNVYAFGASPNGPVALVSAAVAQTINP